MPAANKRIDVTEDEVRTVPIVPFSRSCHSYHHGTVIDQAAAALKDAGVSVVKKRFDLSANGMDLFTTWQLEGEGEYAWEIGFRNSMQNRFPLGAVVGTRVLACSNLCLSRSWMELIKHADGFDEDRISVIFDRAINSIFRRLVEYSSWIDSLRSQIIKPVDVKCLAYDSMVHGVFAPSKFKAFQVAYMEETKGNRVETLYNFQGAVTRLLRGDSLFQLQRRTATLEGVLRRFQAARANPEEETNFEILI